MIRRGEGRVLANGMVGKDRHEQHPAERYFRIPQKDCHTISHRSQALSMSTDFQVTGANSAALFTLKLHRGEGMTLLAMNWKAGTPSKDFAGFAIEYREPGGDRFYPLNNRLGFADSTGAVNPQQLTTRLSPIQKFRWVHFPRFADLPGEFVYRVTPVFMSSTDALSYGEFQEAAIALQRETYPGLLNVSFTRGFVVSQAFVDRYGGTDPDKALATLLPPKADQGLDFIPTHTKAAEAFDWMGFEARRVILDLLEQAIADPLAQVRVVAYDLNFPEIVTRLERLGSRVKVIIDNSDDHEKPGAAENDAELRLIASAGAAQVKRQKMGGLQHNKTIAIDSPNLKAAVCGSTNLSWRGFFAQNNHAVILSSENAVRHFMEAFQHYWDHGTPGTFGKTTSAVWNAVGLPGIDAQIAFSPHLKKNALIPSIAADLASTTSSLLFSMAFLHLTPGAVKDAIKQLQQDNHIFSYGIADSAVKGLELTKPDGTVAVIGTAALKKNLPEPFKSESGGGSGALMHHKFAVIDFDQPSARVYLGSFNFSGAADTSNGENLLLIRDRRIATAFMIEALRIFDHYHFRTVQASAKTARKKLQLKKPPRQTGETAWWEEDFLVAIKIRDRELFA
jgi:phosphatidylserine/phosphatidylglycerophosphate/cardiolipin synthase-like enzyme